MTKYKDLDSSFDEDLQDEDYYLSDNEDNGGNKITTSLMEQKHVETLKFLRQVLKENKDLRNRIDLIQTEIQDSLNEINNARPVSVKKETKIETPLPAIINVLNNYTEKYDVEIQTDEVEKEEEEDKNYLFEEEISSMKKEWEIRKQEYEKELKKVDVENEEFRKENENLIKIRGSLTQNINNLTNQMNEIKREKIELISKIENLNEENKEIDYLKKIIEEQNLIINERNKKVMEKEIQNENLNNRINELIEENAKDREMSNIEINNLKLICTKHDECNQIIENLNQKIKVNESTIYEKDIEIERFNYLTFNLSTENENLKEKMRQNESNMNFKEFIVLKRDNARLLSELSSLKQDQKVNSNMKLTYNESNSSTVATISPTSSPLPPLKESMIKKKPIKKY
jgi:chromosome segregation ATPase